MVRASPRRTHVLKASNGLPRLKWARATTCRVHRQIWSEGRRLLTRQGAMNGRLLLSKVRHAITSGRLLRSKTRRAITSGSLLRSKARHGRTNDRAGHEQKDQLRVRPPHTRPIAGLHRVSVANPILARAMNVPATAEAQTSAQH